MRIHQSARKHGVTVADMLTGIANAQLKVALDDGSPQRQLVLGFDASARLLELIVLVFDDRREPILIHAMPARRKYRNLLLERS